MSTFDPDQKAWADATAKGDDFLVRKGFLPEMHTRASQPSK